MTKCHEGGSCCNPGSDKEASLLTLGFSSAPPKPSARRQPSAEILTPGYNHPSRRSDISVAVFNILATIVGAGVLSLPYAMSKTGWVLGLLMLGLSAAASDFTLYILCSSSRRSGVPSFTLLARHCFGARCEGLVLGLTLLFLLLCVTAFLMLLTDTVGSLVEYAIGQPISHDKRDLVLSVCVWAVLPLCFFRSLHALRYTCYLGFSSVLVLTLSIAYRCLITLLKDPTRLTLIRAWPQHWADPLLVFPIFMLAFMCSFNILPVHGSLVAPSRDRIKIVLHSSIGCTFLVYVVMSLAGYIYALDDTKDDVLNNFPASDSLLLLGRVGLCTTLYFAVPILVLPTRQAALDLWDKCLRFLHRRCCRASWTASTLALLLASPSGGGGGEGEGRGEGAPLVTERSCEEGGLPSSLGKGAHAHRHRGYGSRREEEEGNSNSRSMSSSMGMGEGEMSEAEVSVLQSFKLGVATLAIVLTAAQLAARVPGVAFVWSLCGSSLGFFLGYTLPALYYLTIRQHKQHVWNKGLSWATLGFSLVAIVLCTAANVYSLFAGKGAR